MNNLHLHMYNVGILPLALLLVLYPAENAADVAVKATVAAQTKGEVIVVHK
jgi:hypothetical protein